MPELQPGHYTQGACHTAQGDRAVLASLVRVEGVADIEGGSLAVTLDSGLTFNIAAGSAFIAGDQVTEQGMYHVLNTSTVQITLDAAPVSDSRFDLIIARVYDAQFAGVLNEWHIEKVTGVASPAPVDPAVPDNSIVLARIVVPAVGSATIVDRRRKYLTFDGAEVGEIRMTARSTASVGWLLAQGQAISRTVYAELFAAIGTAYGVGDGSTTFNIPNFKGRVPVGLDAAQTEFDVLGETGGAKTVTLTAAEIPAHTHTIAHTHNVSGGTTSDGSHSHGGATGGINANHSHLPFGAAGQFLGWQTPGFTTLSVKEYTGGPDPFFDFVGSPSTHTESNDHAHAITSDGAHSHTFNVTSGASSAANSGSTGSGGAHNNLQPYAVTNFMIRVV